MHLYKVTFSFSDTEFIFYVVTDGYDRAFELANSDRAAIEFGGSLGYKSYKVEKIGFQSGVGVFRE